MIEIWPFTVTSSYHILVVCAGGEQEILTVVHRRTKQWDWGTAAPGYIFFPHWGAW